jgi:hypothetical protein
MAEVDELQQRLLALQNSDGGWPFAKGSSWTEPTALSLLALRPHTNGTSVGDRALQWLAQRQNRDGGWSPNDATTLSTWVTSLALLALTDEYFHRNAVYRAAAQKAAIALAGLVYSEGGLTNWLIRILGGTPVQGAGSSPWFPGTAGWVQPTSFAILALAKFDRMNHSLEFAPKIAQARAYLLSRRCNDGGWNHGGSSFRSEDAQSYPETTGLALLALAGTPASSLRNAFHLTERYLQRPDSAEGLAWVQMGLCVHGRNAPDPTTPPKPRTVRDLALRLLALNARNGHAVLAATT